MLGGVMMKHFRVFMALLVLSLLIAGCSDKTTEPETVLPQTVATPEFFIDECPCNTTKTITITCATEESEIRFTLDGSVPTASSEVYVEPLIIEQSLVIKAKAYKEGWTPSETASATITFDPLPDFQIEFLNVQESYTLEQIVNIRAAVTEEDGTPAPDLTYVLFSADKGSFGDSANSVIALTSRGYAQANWESGTLSGVVTFTARVMSTGVENEAEAYILPGPPSSYTPSIEYHGVDEIWLPYPEEGLYPSEIDGLRLVLEVKDQFGNPVSKGIPVLLGNSPMIPMQEIAATNADGIAYFTIHLGSHTGVIELSGSGFTISFIVLEPPGN
jgi:hypothetical protein